MGTFGEEEKENKSIHIVYIQLVKTTTTKNLYLFQYKLLYRNETSTNHHGLLSASV